MLKLTLTKFLCDTCIITINRYPVSSQQSDEVNQSTESCTPPLSWAEPSAVFYQRFDSSHGFSLMEGTQTTSGSVPLVSGKVRYIVLFSTITFTVQKDLF